MKELDYWERVMIVACFRIAEDLGCFFPYMVGNVLFWNLETRALLNQDMENGRQCL